MSHGPPGADALPFADVLEIHRELVPGAPLALNIKADGLQPLLVVLLQQHRVRDHFAFDMAVPDMPGYGVYRCRPPRLHPPQRAGALPGSVRGCGRVSLDAFRSDWPRPNSRVTSRHFAVGRATFDISPVGRGRRRHQKPAS